ncbi:MAG: Holliday junction branch migration DNA helicase RuvB [Parachlamydiales bacterium]
MNERFIESNLKRPDPTFETPLRPKRLEDFVGQEGVCDRLSVLLEAAKGRREPLPHALFCGPPGLGKTTLAHILARQMGSKITVTSGAVIDKAGDLAGLLTHLEAGDLLFIDEIHRLPRAVEEYLYPAMEDFTLDLMLDSGPAARSVQVELKPFTLIGATTRTGQLTSPLRSRFGMTLRLDYYEEGALTQIVERSARLLGMEMGEGAAAELAGRARGTPRVANNLLRWVRDYAQIRAGGEVSREVVERALAMLEIDALGLDEMDKRLLAILCNQYEGGPVGLSTLAVALGEEKQTLEEVYEPYLILRGLIKRTPRGRQATPLAFSALGK